MPQRDPITERTRNLARAQVNVLAPDEVAEAPDEPSVFSTAAAYLHNETLVGGLVDYTRIDAGERAEDKDPFFNATQFYAENQEEFKDLRPFVLDGVFDGFQNESGFRAKADVLRDELENKETIQNSSILGHIAGFGIAAVADLGALLPLGGVGATAARASLRFGVEAAGVTLAQETILARIQETRTTEDVLLATAMGGVLGGAIGPVAHALGKRGAASQVQKALDTREELPIQDLVPGQSSASAAQAPAQDVEFVRGPVGKTLDKVASALGPFAKTPTVVAATATLQSSKNALNKLVDLGLTTKGSLDGEAISATAEDALVHHEVVAAVTMSRVGTIFRDANVAAGDSGGKAFNVRSSVNQTAVSRADFDRAVYRRLLNPEGDPPNVPWAKQVDEAAEVVRKHFSDYYDEGVRLGMFPAGKRLENYVPQMWNRNALMERPDRVREKLLEHFQKDIDEEWLQTNFGHTRKAFDNLDDIEKKEIQDLWNAEDEIIEFEKADARVKDLETELKSAKVAATTASREARKAGTAELNSRLRAARADAKALESRSQSSRARHRAIQAERDAFQLAAEASRHSMLVRQRAGLPMGVADQGVNVQKAHAKMTRAGKALDEYVDGAAGLNVKVFDELDMVDGKPVPVAGTKDPTQLRPEVQDLLADAMRILPENTQLLLAKQIKLGQTGSVFEAGGFHRRETVEGMGAIVAFTMSQRIPVSAAGRTIRHEAIHALRSSGVLSPVQWKVLETAALDNGWLKQFRVRERWHSYYTNSPFYKNLQNGPQAKADAWLKEKLIEEAVAEGYAHFIKNGSSARLGRWEMTGGVGGVPKLHEVFGYLKHLVDATKKALKLHKLDSPEQIFEKIEKGKLKGQGIKKTLDPTTLKKLTADFNRAKSQFEQQLGRPIVGKQDPRFKTTESDPRFQYLRGRAERAGKDADKWDQYASSLEKRHADLDGKFGEIQGLNNQMKALKAARQAKKLEADAAKKLLAKNLKSAKGERAKATNRKSTIDRVNQTIRGLQNRDEMPGSMMYDDYVGQSSRQKYRKLNLNESTVNELMEEGFLESDLDRMLGGYSRDLGGRMAIRDVMGESDDLQGLRNSLTEEYDSEIEKLFKAGKDAEAKKLTKEREEVLSTITLVRDRLLGRHDHLNSSAGEALMYFGRVARNANFLRFMGSVMVSSITDLATASLSAGFKSLPMAFTRNIEKIVREAPQRELMTILYATENNPMFNRMSRLYDIGNDFESFGFGSGTTRKVSSAVENGTQFMTDQMNTLNGMRFWNGRLKFAVGYNIMNNMMDAGRILGKGGKLSDRQINDMAVLGLDENALRDMAKLTDEFGDDIEGGLKFPQLDKWRESGERGAALERKLYTALNRALDKAVVTPRIADTPPFMSSWVGRLMFQFQSFAFASVNRWGREIDRRLIAGGMDGPQAMEVANHVGFMMAMGLASYVIREGGVKGEWDKIKEQRDKGNVGHFVREAVDRGGFMFFMNPYFNTAMKTLSTNGVPVEDYGLLPTRYKQNSPFAGLLGPSFQLGVDLQKMVTPSNTDQFVKTAKRLTPFNNVFYIDRALRSVYDF